MSHVGGMAFFELPLLRLDLYSYKPITWLYDLPPKHNLFTKEYIVFFLHDIIMITLETLC